MSAMDVDPSASTSEPVDVKPVIKKKPDGAAKKGAKDKSGKKFEVKKVSLHADPTEGSQESRLLWTVGLDGVARRGSQGGEREIQTGLLCRAHPFDVDTPFCLGFVLTSGTLSLFGLGVCPHQSLEAGSCHRKGAPPTSTLTAG